MQAIMDEPLEQLKYYRFTHNHYQGERVLTSRTGYTGEVGFEIYCDPDLAESLWNDCIGLGAVPAGLGARDTLRLEMGFPLYGHELDEDRNPAETGFSRAIDDGKEFIGSDVVLDPAAAREVLVGIELEGRRAARSGDPIKTPSGEEIGVVTSGSFAPSLEKAVAMGYILRAHSAEGTGVLVETDRQKLQATITGLPFYKNATARKPLADFL
jgi:aminomethyltransferase